MKIHPNTQFNQMLKNGSARIIDYKYIPYGSMPVHKMQIMTEHVEYNATDFIGNLTDAAVNIISSVQLKNEAEPVIIEKIPLEPVPSAVSVEAKPPEPIPSVDAVEVILPEPMPSAAAVEVILPEPMPSTAAVEEILPEPMPSAAAIEVILPEPMPSAAAVEVILPEPIPSTAAVETILPEPIPSAAAVETILPEPMPSTAAVETILPEPMPSTAVVEAKLPEPMPSAAAVEVILPEPMPSTATIEEKPTNVPGCLVMELHMDVDPNGMIFRIQPEPFKRNFDKESSEPASYEPTQAASAVLGVSSVPPFINFVTFNRLGLTVKNLTRLLDSDEDFELNIIDCNSKDNSWDYILSLTDSRIKSKIRFDKNCGPIFAVNFALSRRKPNQYFITVDSDTYIETKNWIARFMEVFEAFPDVGLLGLMRDNPYPRFLPPIIPRVNGNASYLELKNADIETQMDFIPGHLQCLSPGMISEIGYWSEENGFGDAELSPRVVHYTNYKVGFITTVEIDMTQRITCGDCMGKEFCTLSRSVSDCFSLSKKYNKNESFVAKNTWKFIQAFQELKEGQRTAYCASIHDPESMRTHKYHKEWSYDNFSYYIMNGN